jgi:hypothetical protein
MQRQASVVPARWWHLTGLSGLIRETRRRRSEDPDKAGQALVWQPRWSPSLALLQSVWSAPVPGVRVPLSFVAEQDPSAGSGGTRKPIGLGQLRPRREAHQWEVAYLAVEAPVGVGGQTPNLRLVPDRTASRLLGALCDAAIEQGADRILARMSDGGGRYELFRQLGFSLAVREYSYFGALTGSAPGQRVSPDLLAERVPGLRPQRRADAHNLLQLYARNTPKMVQMVEGKRSHSWETAPVGLGKRLTRGSGVQRWVVERNAETVGWLQIQRLTRGPHQVRILVDERAAELNQSLVDFALDVLSGAGEPTAAGAMLRVREYQERLINALEASQFFLVDAQLLMAKMLATPVLQPQFGRVLEKVV